MKASDVIKIDHLLQFILSTAGQEDFQFQELGNIHLIKYLYLADFEYAKKNNGIPYTSIRWVFHHFGPWCNDAYNRIEPALESIGAKKNIIESEDYGEFVRWSVIDDELYSRLENELPLVITTCIHKYVHKFNSLTADLLDFVYKTFPMLRAKPGDVLNFNIPDYTITCQENQNITSDNNNDLTAKQKKNKKLAVEALKIKFKEKLESRKRKTKPRFAAPPYDDIYFEGLKILDSLAGEEIKKISGIVSFSDDIWHSKARFDPDVSR